jgi:hypothetical protein
MLSSYGVNGAILCHMAQIASGSSGVRPVFALKTFRGEKDISPPKNIRNNVTEIHWLTP